MGPAAPKPTIPSTAGAKTGAKQTPTMVLVAMIAVPGLEDGHALEAGVDHSILT